jgi:CDP-glucose 4,6-dehydratase
MFDGIYRGKKIFLTGHTGFKGGWLAEWLLHLGAEVIGYALAPSTQPALFEELQLASRVHHRAADICDATALQAALNEAQPDFVFHLAAQPLVRRSYQAPVETYQTNVNGTLYLLEALRTLQKPCVAIIVTTDKCYENREHGLPYREEDHLGGRDPYSSSKAMAEILTAAYRQSYFESGDSPIRIATARAGNVIGGGDWAEDRIVPDCIRALEKGAPIAVRNPRATRPWQHVLEPLSGYLLLAARLYQNAPVPPALNFGPNPSSNRSVEELVTEGLQYWPGAWSNLSDPNAPHEARLLSLSIEKATDTLQWRPVWSFAETVAHTISWYRAFSTGEAKALSLTQQQIARYMQEAAQRGAEWAIDPA